MKGAGIEFHTIYFWRASAVKVVRFVFLSNPSNLTLRSKLGCTESRMAMKRRAPKSTRQNEAMLLLQEFGLDKLPQKEALERLGVMIADIKAQGHTTDYLDSLVDAILGMPAELKLEDKELAKAWEKYHRGGN